MLAREWRSMLRSVALVALVAVWSSGCATGRTGALVSAEPLAFVSEVSDEEWQAAISARESGIAEPRLKKGTRHPNGTGIGLEVGEQATTILDIVIRADGTVGIRAILSSTNARFTERVVALTHSQRFEPPVVNGNVVPIRGDMTYTTTRTQ